MKVALYGTYNTSDTGPSRVTEGLATGLAQNGCNVDVYAHGDKQTGERFDVYHLGHTPESMVGFYERMKECNSLITRRDYDIFHPLEAFYRPTPIRTVQWTSGVYERKKRAPRDFGGYQSLLGDVILNGINRVAATFSEETVATSPETVRQMRRYWKLAASQVIPLGVENEWLQEPVCGGDPVDLLMVGRITQKKGQKDVLEHLDPNDDSYNIRIVGSVADEEYYQQLSRWYHACEGFVERKKLKDLYRESDVVLVPSRHENFSVVAMEAIAGGSIVVITTKCGFAQFDWATQENGIHVVPDGEEMANVVQNIAGRDVFEQKQSAYELAQRMVWEKIAERYVDKYRQLQ